tara:strand:- start:547 stop:783 length:237 start_codon:yes stop_codon:yes gene_type:complete
MSLQDVKEVNNDFEECFSSPSGGRVLEWLENNFVYRSSHTPGDAYETAFREGQRAIVLMLREKVKMAKYPNQIEEFYG